MRQIKPTLVNYQWVASEYAFRGRRSAEIAAEINVSATAVNSWIERLASNHLGFSEFARVWWNVDRRELLRAILVVAQGCKPEFEPRASIHAERVEALRQRREVLEAIRAGETLKGISARLAISYERTRQLKDGALQDIRRAIRELETVTSLGLPVSDETRLVLLGVELGGDSLDISVA